MAADLYYRFRPYYYRMLDRISQVQIPWEIGWILVVFVLMANTGCAAVQNGNASAPAYTNPLPGDVLPLRMSTVLRELRWTVMGSTRNVVMLNQANNNLLISFPYLNGWGWICINGNSANVCNALRAIGGRGNFANSYDFNSLIKGAEQVGYRTITSADLVKLFPALAKSIMDATGMFANSVMPSLFVLPAGVIGDDPWASSVQ